MGNINTAAGTWQLWFLLIIVVFDRWQVNELLYLLCLKNVSWDVMSYLSYLTGLTVEKLYIYFFWQVTGDSWKICNTCHIWQVTVEKFVILTKHKYQLRRDRGGTTNLSPHPLPPGNITNNNNCQLPTEYNYNKSSIYYKTCTQTGSVVLLDLLTSNRSHTGKCLYCCCNYN